MAKKTAKKKHYQFSISEIIIISIAILLALFATFYPQITGNATAQTYKTVNIQHATVDLRSVGINLASASVLKISTATSDLVMNTNLLSVPAGQTIAASTSTIYLYHNSANILNVYYLNGQTLTYAGTLNLASASETAPAQFITTSAESTGTVYNIDLYFRDASTVRIHVESPQTGGHARGNIISIWTTSVQTSFSALGTQTNIAENSEVRWKEEGSGGAVYIGDQGDYTTPYGIIARATRTNAQQDKFVVDLPIMSTQTPPACGNQVCEASETCEWNQAINTNILCSNNSRIAPGGMSCSNCVLSTCGDGICGALEGCEWNGALNRQMLCDGSQSVIPSGGSCANCAYTAPPASTSTCTDTDGGGIRRIRGTVSGIDTNGQPYTYTDTCINITTLTEYFCTGAIVNSTSGACNATNGATCIDGECGYCGNGVCNTGESCEFDSVNTRNFACSTNLTITSTQTCTACVLGTTGGSSGGDSGGSGSSGGNGGSGSAGTTPPVNDGSTGTTLPPQIGNDQIPEDTPSVCGNFIADAGEDCSSCPQDVQCPSNQLCIQGTCRSADTPEVPAPTNYIPVVIIGLFVLVLLGGAGAYYYVKKHPKQPAQQPPKNMWR